MDDLLNYLPPVVTDNLTDGNAQYTVMGIFGLVALAAANNILKAIGLFGKSNKISRIAANEEYDRTQARIAKENPDPLGLNGGYIT